MAKIIFEWPSLRLEWDTRAGYADTIYPDGTHSGCWPHSDDAFHGMRLGLTPEEHRLHHELAHHLLGFALGNENGSGVVWRDAHQETQPERKAELEEWMTTALQYLSLGKSADFGALVDIQGYGIDVRLLSQRLRALMDLAQTSVALGHTFTIVHT